MGRGAELSLTTEERACVGLLPIEIFEGRKRRAEVWRNKLKDPLVPREVLEPVLTEVFEEGSGWPGLSGEFARRPGEEDLTSVRGRADPGGSVHVEAEVTLVADCRFPKCGFPFAHEALPPRATSPG